MQPACGLRAAQPVHCCFASRNANALSSCPWAPPVPGPPPAGLAVQAPQRTHRRLTTQCAVAVATATSHALAVSTCSAQQPHVGHGARPTSVSITNATASVQPPLPASASLVHSGWQSVLAVWLGYAVLVGSCFRSVPQIIKAVRAGSAEGLSLTSNVSEMLCYTVMVAYNLGHGHPFNTFGEVLACWVQDVIIVALIVRHVAVPLPLLLAGGGALVLLCAWLFTPGLCSMELLAAMQASTLFVMAVFGRMPQILLNARRGDAGVMSMTTCVLNVLGNGVRIFTTLVLTQDSLLLAGCCTQGVLNSILLAQVWRTKLQHRQVNAAVGIA